MRISDWSSDVCSSDLPLAGSEYVRKGPIMRDKLAGLKESNAPLYLQLARNLREHIQSGGVEPGEPLPSERELSERMGMSRVTIRKGIQKLIEEGLIFRRTC